MTRDVNIQITAAQETGFLAWESGEVVAAFTSRAEIANWLEARLGDLPGELEREAQDRADTMEALPNVIQRTDRKKWFGGAP